MAEMNFGSGSALLGGNAGDALSQAIQRRSLGQGGATSQVSAASPTAMNQVPPSPDVTGQVSPASVGVPMPSSQPAQPQGMPANTPESELIIKALDSRLKSLSKLQGA